MIFRSKPFSPLVVALPLCLTTLRAQAENKDQDPNIDFAKPFTYSLSLMAVGLPTLVGSGAFEDGPSTHNFARAFSSPPRWDHDSAMFNFVLHPLWGSETYLRAREANWGMAGSIAFSMGMSATWEYLYESWVMQPSTQDLIFTTGIGWMIGEARYKLKQRTSEKWDWALDPIHTTLEHLQVKRFRDPKGHVTTVYGLEWEF